MTYTSNNKKRTKRIWLLIILLLLGIAVVICVKRWNAWFGNPVEPVYSSSNVPTRIQLTLGNDGQFSRNISWQCGNTLATSQLLIVKQETTDTTAIAAEGKILYTQGGTTVIYYAKLTGLTEGVYSYRVCTGDKYSAWSDFTINASNTFRVVYFGDIQDTVGSTTKEVLSSINRREKDAAFWALGGDVVERPHDRYWNEYFTAMDSIARTVPVIACPGNHEYIKGITGKLEERFVYTFSYLVDSRNNKHAVFATHYGNAAIIMLDSNCDTWTLLSQRSWLKQALENAKDAQWKIVILHHPIHSVRGKSRHFFIRRLLDPLIRQYNVDIVLQGHEHCYARMTSKDENNVSTTPVYVIDQFSPKDYKINFDEKYDRFGNGLRFYQTVDVGNDTLSLKTLTENGELYDYVSIVKTGGNLQMMDLATGIPEHFDINLSRIQKIKSSQIESYRKEIENRLKKDK